MVAIWDLIGVRESAVLGLSLGGMTALGLALDHGPRVTRMVAADCRADAPDFFRTMWTDRQRILTEQGMDAIADLTLPTWLTEKTRGTRPDLVSRVRRMILETSHEGYRAATAALRGLNYKHRLTAIECPTCFMVGAADGVHPAEMRAMAELDSRCGVCSRSPAAAHLANLENPDAFNEAIRAFLSAQNKGRGKR